MSKKGICVQIVEDNQILANSYYENYSGIGTALSIIKNIIDRYNRYASIRNLDSSLFAIRLLENYESNDNSNITSVLRKESYYAAIKDFQDESFYSIFKDNELEFKSSENYTDDIEDDFFDYVNREEKKESKWSSEDEDDEFYDEYNENGLIGYVDEDIDLNLYNAEMVVEIYLNNNTISISGDLNKKYYTEVERLFEISFDELDLLDINLSGFPFYELEDLEEFIKSHSNSIKNSCPYFRILPDEKFAYCVV